MLHKILKQIPGYLFVKDRNSRFIGCNQNFAEFAGETMESIIGKHETEMPWKEVADHFIQDDRHVMETELPLIDYHEKKPNDDGHHDIVTNKYPFYDDSGNVIGVIGIFFIVENK